MAVPSIKQLYHLTVLSYYFYFNATSLGELLERVSRVEGLKDDVFYMVPQFATIWTQFVFQDYFFLSCLENLLAFTSKTFLHSFKQILADHANNLFIYITLPFTLTICFNFWFIYYIDRRLIDQYNALFDVFDSHANHVVHTAVIPILLIELFVTNRRYPTSLTVAHPLWKMTVPFACYWTVVFGMKIISPVWPYPYFKLMKPLQWVAYILVNLVLAYFVYVIGYLCNALFWGKNDENIEESSTKKTGWNLASDWSTFSRLIQVMQRR